MGNPSSDHYGGDRLGSNLYTNSLVALDADTGTLTWYFQETPHDLYDFDSNGEPMLLDVERDGDLIFGGDPDGDAWALDAKTGDRLWSFNTGGGISSGPMTYSVHGRQDVAIGTGMGALNGSFVPRWWPEEKDHLPQHASTLFVFALPNP